MTASVELVAVGGLGQFGMNCALLRCGGEALVVDVGLAFPGAESCGLEAIVPDLEPLLGSGCRAAGIVLTHAHDDHIGGVARALSSTDCPVYGSDFTIGLLAERLAARGVSAGGRLRVVSGRDRIPAGPFTVEFLDVTHSVPGAFALAIGTPSGVFVHSADFKLDETPHSGPRSDLDRLSELGREGVRALLLDSTNAAVAGSTPSERAVVAPFTRLLGDATGRVFVTTFSSHIPRIESIAAAAERTGRRIAVVGRRLEASVEIARALGQLRLPPGLLVQASEAMARPGRESVVIAGGAQGEFLSAMSRIARGAHPQARVEPGDLVIHSARPIPGEEVAIGRMLDDLARRGARIAGGAASGTHVSGHASAEDLGGMIDRLRPEILVPVHGGYRNLLACAELGRSRPHPPRTILLAENGDIIHFDASGARVAGRAATRVIYEDHDHERLDEDALRERRLMAESGLLAPLVVREGGRVRSDGLMVVRGFQAPESEPDLFDEARRLVSQAARASSGPDGSAGLSDRVRDDLARLVRRRTGKRPLIAPVVIEL